MRPMKRAGVDETCDLLDELACVWVGVADIDEAARIFTDVLGLELQGKGGLSKAVDLWNGSTVGDPRRWIYVQSSGEKFGGICLFEDGARRYDGSLPRGWDSVELVVEDVDAAALRLAGVAGAIALVKPFTSDLSEMGSNIHRSGLWRMPWGTHLILTAGVTEPESRAFPKAQSGTGRVFEVHLRTDRFEQTRHLYADVLGMPMLIDVELTQGPIHQAWSLRKGHPVAMSFLKSGGRGTGGGAVELQGHPTCELQTPPSLADQLVGGTAMVTFSSKDIDAAHEAIKSDGGFATTPVNLIAEGPFTGRRSFRILGGESERLEIVE